MAQDPNQPPQPQWDPQRGQWYIPGPQQPPQGAGPYGQQSGMPPAGDTRYGQQPYGAPGHVPPPPPPPRKTRKWPWIVGAAVLLILIIAVSSGGNDAPANAGGVAAPAASSTAASTSASSAPSSAAGAGGVVYEVTGSGRANNITYGDVSKGLSQANGERLPWTKTMAATEGFGIYGLTAQNGGSGQITCRITVDGREIASNSSSGQYALVSCNGTTSPF